MFGTLLAAPAPQVAQGYAVNVATLRSRLSTNTAADATPQYMGHVDIPAGALTGLSTDWNAHIKVLYESGTYAGTNHDAAPIATTNLTRRFSVRISDELSLDPTVLGNSTGVADPAEAGTNIGGQFSVDISAVAGTFGCEIRGTAMWDTQGAFLRHTLPLNRWVDSYPSGGLRICVFFNWESPFAANTIMKVVSTTVTLVPGAATRLVTAAAPRTLTAAMFGAHWNNWPLAADNGVAPPLGVTAGAVRWHDYGPPDITFTAFGAWPTVESLNWSALTAAQQDADPGWEAVDRFVTKHATRRKILTLNGTPAHYAADRRAPPSDLASGVTSSWYRFCTRIGTRYAGQGIHYEIWNEPNTTGNAFIGWTGTQAQLVSMVTLAAQALRAVDPSCKILGPAFVNIMNRASDLNFDTTKAFYALSAGAALTAVDYVSYHTYPLKSANPLGALMFTKNMRRLLTELGAPTKPIYMTEMSCENPKYPLIPQGERLAFMQRSIITLLCGDAYSLGAVWYGLDHGTLAWVQSDADAWNQMQTFLMSGPITNCTVNQDGTVSVTIGTTSRIY